MEKKDLELVKKYAAVDDDLRRHIEEHQKYELMLEEFKKRVHLTPEEEVEVKRIKKLKLRGRDKIEQILARYR